jgi:hypothetical protein
MAQLAEGINEGGIKITPIDFQPQGMASHGADSSQVDASRATLLAQLNSSRTSIRVALDAAAKQFSANIPEEPAYGGEPSDPKETPFDTELPLTYSYTRDGGMADPDYVPPKDRKYVSKLKVQFPQHYTLQDLRLARAEIRSMSDDLRAHENAVTQHIREVETAELARRQHETAQALKWLWSIVTVFQHFARAQVTGIGMMDQLLTQQLKIDKAITDNPDLLTLVQGVGSGLDPLYVTTSWVLTQLHAQMDQPNLVEVLRFLCFRCGNDQVVAAVREFTRTYLSDMELTPPEEVEQSMDQEEKADPKEDGTEESAASEGDGEGDDDEEEGASASNILSSFPEF